MASNATGRDRPLLLLGTGVLLVLLTFAPAVTNNALGAPLARETEDEPLLDVPDVPEAFPLPRPVAKWTLMIYLDADNNLESAGIEDINEMETVGSTPEVNIIVQMDRCGTGHGYDDSNGDWTGAKRFYVTKDDDPDIIGSRELADLGEVNMGDPTVTTNFTDWAVANFPAENYGLVFWNHGGSFHGVCWDDDNDEDRLTMPEVGAAVGQLRDRLEDEVDLVGFDACNMGDMGVMYELYRKAAVGVASAYSEPGEGWPYETILPALVAQPDMAPETLGALIAEMYVESYTDRGSDPIDSAPISQAAFDLTAFGVLEDRLSRLGMYLATHADLRLLQNGKWPQIQQARSDTNSYDMVSLANELPLNNLGSLYDLVDLLDNLAQNLGLDTTAQRYIRDVEAATARAIIFNAANPLHERVKDAHGLTLWFPLDASTDSALETFQGLRFAKDSYWDEFLLTFASRQRALETPPLVRITAPATAPRIDLSAWSMEQDGARKASTVSILLTGTAFDLQQPPAAVEVRVDDGNWTEVPLQFAEGDTGAEWRYRLLLPPRPGNYTVSVRAEDEAGTYSTEDRLEITLSPGDEADISPSDASGRSSLLIGALIGLAAALGVVIFISRHRKEKQ